jgi:putative acetyltransferase
MSRFSIRRAGERDFDALTDLWERSARTSHGFMSDDDFADVHSIVRDGLLPSMDVWVAEDDAGRPLGFVGAREEHVELLYVEPDAHGRGVGTRLLARVGKDGPTSVEVYAGNTHGLGFYESHGFRRLRTHTTDGFGRPFPIIHLQRDPGR